MIKSLYTSVPIALRTLVVGAMIPVLGCGDPYAGSIKAPKRDEMPGGQSTSGAPEKPAKGKGRRSGPELKTMTLGGKKM